ncbi:hypothetical protein IMZ48_34870 [Candidatus Bathyarchaeota archaeon]|nr:hypothetical protein [Candidatus Bathyarchaeota archaeon]
MKATLALYSNTTLYRQLRSRPQPRHPHKHSPSLGYNLLYNDNQSPKTNPPNPALSKLPSEHVYGWKMLTPDSTNL